MNTERPASTGGARPYEPIDCSLHDQLEAAATLHQPMRIAYRVSPNEVARVDERIVDVYARDGVEYLRMVGGAEIRLDDIVSVDASF